ncbi:MAG: hypothetical protein HRT74_12165, partial [Flavobacteriales bacterium]|nr:hypothetical protein [Flavobacteriales bacterium]
MKGKGQLKCGCFEQVDPGRYHGLMVSKVAKIVELSARLSCLKSPTKKDFPKILEEILSSIIAFGDEITSAIEQKSHAVEI